MEFSHWGLLINNSGGAPRQGGPELDTAALQRYRPACHALQDAFIAKILPRLPNRLSIITSVLHSRLDKLTTRGFRIFEPRLFQRRSRLRLVVFAIIRAPLPHPGGPLILASLREHHVGHLRRNLAAKHL